MVENIYPISVVNRVLPINLVQEDSFLFEHELFKIIRTTTLSSLSYVYVLNDTLFHIGTLRFHNSDTHVFPLTNKKLFNNLLLLFKKGKVINNAIWIIDNWSEGYFHWFTDALPRLIASEKRVSNHSIVLPICYKKLQYVIDSLNILNYNVDFYDSKLLIRNLLLPSHTAESGNYNVEILKTLRNKFKIFDNTLGNRKIYVSRNKALKRKISNEEQVLKLLILFEYEIHYFEDYQLIDQIKLLQQAKCLIGLHGAGLTNMLFMPVKSNILELRNKADTHNNCYFSLASDLGMNYYYQQCIGTTSETHFSDLEVCLLELEKNLRLMEIKNF